MSTIPVMHAEINSQFKQLDTVQLLPAGFSPARLYAICDMGHQHSNYYNKWIHKVDFVFEFPGLRQLFYEEDTEPRPTYASIMMTLSMDPKSKLRPFVGNALGVTLTDEQAEAFNIYELADKLYNVQINHTAPNDKGEVYANVVGISPFDKRLATGIDLTPYNELSCYHLPTHGFLSPEYIALPAFKRKDIANSQEGLDYAATGGKFGEPEKKEGGASTAQAPAGAQAPPPAGVPNMAPASALQMLVSDFSYEQYKQQGWTDELLIQHGKAKKNAVAPVVPQQQLAQAPPVIPQAPTLPQNPNLQKLQGDVDDSDMNNVAY